MTTRQQTADSKQIRKFAMHLIHKVTGSTYFVGFPIIFLRMLNHDHKAALLLNQILYWCERTKHPEGWFYKTYDEWNEELGLSAAEIRRIVKGDKRVKDPKSVLGDYGVETAVKRAPDGSPTVHYRIDQEIFLKKLMDHLHVDPNPTDKLMIFENEQCLVSKMNNVEDGKSTMLRMENQQCSHSYTESPSKNPAKNSTVESPHPPIQPDNTTMTMDDVSKKLRKPTKTIRKQLEAQQERLGQALYETVVLRCMENNPQSWRYIVTALQNEPVPPAEPTQSAESTVIDEDAEFEQQIARLRERNTVTATERVQQTRQFGSFEATIAEHWRFNCRQLKDVLGASHYNMLMRDTHLVDFDGETATFTLVVANRYNRDMLTHRVRTPLHRTTAQTFGLPSVQFVILLADEWPQAA